MWDKLIPLMPQGLRLIRFDKRGHGLSSCPSGPYSMGALVRDAERLIDALSVRDCVFVGLSVGGLTEPATVMPVQIFLWSDGAERAFEPRTAAAILVLLALMIVFNAVAVFLRRRFERRW